MRYCKTIIFFLILIAIQGCSVLDKDSKKEEDSILNKNKTMNPDLKERQEKFSGTIFQGGKSNGANNFEFATSNVLWRASIQTLDFMPLTTLSYSGGVIVTDWYSKNSGKESIKIMINFNSSELKTSSVEVISFKKKCSESVNENCSIQNLDNSFNEKIKNQILTKAREISLASKKVKK